MDGLREGKLEGLREGKLEGELKTLVRGFERRLQRSLTDAEREVVAVRLQKLGADRLLDVQTELAADALAAWLADSSAT